MPSITLPMGFSAGPVAGNRSQYLPLLILADEAESIVRSYIDEGELWVIRGDTGTDSGVILMISDGDAVEIKNIALRPNVRRQGIGRAVLEAMVQWYGRAGYKRMVVGTGNSSTANLTFYQKSGFRMTHIRRDFFSKNYPHPIFENGIECRDMVMFERILDPLYAARPPLVGALHHVEINVSSIEASTAFWRWLLEEELGYDAFQTWNGGRSWRRGNTYIVFVQTARDQLTPVYHRRRVGLNHIAFHGESRAHVDHITNRLRDLGIRVLYEDRHPFAGGASHYAVFFEDPEGIKVEVVAPHSSSNPTRKGKLWTE